MASDSRLASVQEHSSSGQRCQSQREHEVFLSHSGYQKGFVGDLFDDLVAVPRFQFNEPFFDKEDESLLKGKEFASRIIYAARNCAVAVMILTKDYLTSYWPMLELLHFIDARKDTNRHMRLLPVFYDNLQPSDLGDRDIEDKWKVAWEKIIPKQSSVVHREISLTEESCKEALKILKKINGIVARKDQASKSLREKIVSAVLKFLPSSVDSEIRPDIEGGRRLCDVISKMFQKDDKERECLGLYGVGGSGKTTMCEALCCYFGSSFNYKVYHLKIGSNDRVKSQENLFQRHKELLRKLIGLSQAQVDRIGDPRKALKMRLEKQPVFLAVDDVREDLDSCQEVRIYLSYLCPGSKIIITARSQNIVQSVIGHPKFCKPIPHLQKDEALSLFLKIAAPERSLTSLDRSETWILGECLQICFFPVEGEANHNLFPREAVGDPSVPTEVGHYHPLALRAVASYFKDQYSKLGSIVQCGEDLIHKKKLIFCSDDPKKIIFDVLEIGFNEICHVGKQLFIDVALFAPPPNKDEDIFNWLVVIHANLNPDVIRLKLEHLRKMAFLNYGDGISGHISMHDLYREYAKIILNKHKNGDSYKYGVYCNYYYQAPPVMASTDWEKVPRVRLEMWKDVIKLKEWCGVSVIHLVKCETITTFPIGRELFNLRDLRIRNCSKLEELSWTQEIMTEKLVSDVKLCFVELLFNKNLKTLPDFCDCSELRQITVIECSSSVKPLHLHNCSSLQLLHVAGENVLEVQSLKSCSKLGSVQLTWDASHKGLQARDLPSLSEISIAGFSILPMNSLHELIVPHGHNLFCRHYPEETICVELTGAWELTNLKSLNLNYIPLGCLPKGLREIGSSLEYLNLRGCLLSQLVDFSEFPNLEYLSIAQTNVKEVRGIGGLKKLVYLDCRFNFRLKKISDLRPSLMLKYVLLDQCPELQAIPRLPPRCWESGSEDGHRLWLAVNAFANTAISNIPPPFFAFGSWMPSTNFVTEVTDKLSRVTLSKGVAVLPHRSVICDGCCMPLMGPRYKARDIWSTYDLCDFQSHVAFHHRKNGVTGRTGGQGHSLDSSTQAVEEVSFSPSPQSFPAIAVRLVFFASSGSPPPYPGQERGKEGRRTQSLLYYCQGIDCTCHSSVCEWSKAWLRSQLVLECIFSRRTACLRIKEASLTFSGNLRLTYFFLLEANGIAVKSWRARPF